MKASDLLVRCLENEAVSYVFCLPGEEILDILNSLVDSPIQCIAARDERAAAFMANVYGRLTGKAGVCLATLGPGATNLLTGVADANLDCVPLVAITGQASLDRMRTGSHQYIDTLSLYRPVTKQSTRISLGHTVPEVIRGAFKSAQTERPGSIHIEFPEDIAAENIAEDEPLFVQAPVVPEPLQRKVVQAREIISQAKRPVVLVGNGVVRAHAHEAVREFSRALNIPVTHTFMAKGVMPDSNPLSLYTLGGTKQQPILSIFEEADVVIAVGYDFVEYAPCFWNSRRDKHIVHINVLPAEVDKHYIVNVGVLGDISITLQEIQAGLQECDQSWAVRCRTRLIAHLRKKFDPIDAVGTSASPLRPPQIIHTLRSVLDKNDIVVCDVGEHKLQMAELFPCEEPNTCIISNGLATMGIGLPGGIAAKLLFPEQKVVVVTGDGGFMMNSQEIETAMRLGISIVVLLWRDDGYGVIRKHQIERFDRLSASSFGNPDFVRYAQSFGAPGFRIVSPSDLKPALEQALCLPKLSLIDCPVQY